MRGTKIRSGFMNGCGRPKGIVYRKDQSEGSDRKAVNIMYGHAVCGSIASRRLNVFQPEHIQLTRESEMQRCAQGNSTGIEFKRNGKPRTEGVDGRNIRGREKTTYLFDADLRVCGEYEGVASPVL